MNRLTSTLQLLAVGVSALSLAACSCEASAEVGPADGDGGSSGDGGTSSGGTSSGGTSSGGSGGTTGGAGGTAGSAGGMPEAGATVTLSGTVYDGSTSSGIDDSSYTELDGVEVCVEGDDTIACAMTETDGTYAIEVPASTELVLTFVKDGFVPTRFAVTSGPMSSTVQFILLPTQTQADGFVTAAGFTPDESLGTIQFGAITPSTDTSAMFYQEWGGMGFEYVEGFTATIAPDADHGPVYTGTDWNADPTLTTSSAAGWGVFYTAPGDYDITITHPELDCGVVPTATVVAGWSTTYVGTACNPPGDGGVADGGFMETDAGTDGGDGG